MSVIGHKSVLEKLNHLLATDTVGHAYLFVGPHHVGKTTVAQMFATALVNGKKQCPAPQAHTDIYVVEPENVVTKSGARRTKSIGVETVRTVTTYAAQTPLAGVRRVIIIASADKLTIAAQNALLKTLEEPAEHTVIILTTAYEGQLLETVRSRAQRIALLPVSDNEIAAVVEKCIHDKARRDMVISAAHGCPGIALAIIRDKKMLAWYDEIIKYAHDMPQMTDAQKIACAEKLAADGESARTAIVTWMHIWRRSLDKKSDSERRSRMQWLESAHEALTVLNTMQVNTRLTLEHLLFKIK